MKKLLTICLLFVINSIVNAQSNEETIKFIEANLKKIVGQKDERGNLFTNVSFDGEKLITTQNIGSSEDPNLYTRNHSNLNWENVTFRIYDDESLKSKIPGFERLWVSFEKPIRYKVNDGEVIEKTTANFYVPIDKVEDLKKAFLSVLPLQEMAKEPTSVNAQDGKPTKEQTMEFIKSYFKGKSFGGECSWESQFTFTISNFYKDYELVLEGNILTVKWQQYYEYRINEKVSTDSKDRKIAEIDLSKTETVSVFQNKLARKCSDQNQLEISAGFKTIPSFKNSYTENGKVSNPEWVLIPINSYICNGCDNELVNKKIIQAFNHLRKLCGAPEPINFDN